MRRSDSLIDTRRIGEIVGCLNQKILETDAENFQDDSLNKTKPFVILHVSPSQAPTTRIQRILALRLPQFSCNLAIQIVIFSSIIIGLFRQPNGPLEGGSNFFVKFIKSVLPSLMSLGHGCILTRAG